MHCLAAWNEEAVGRLTCAMERRCWFIEPSNAQDTLNTLVMRC